MGTRDAPRRGNHQGSRSLPRRVAGLNIVAILGHTASGKSMIAEATARRFGAEIISVDSMQVFRGMDIGTAKPSPRVRAEIPHHMVDVADPPDDFDVTTFQAMARKAIKEAVGRSGRVVIAGGSGLHYRVIVDPYTFAPTDQNLRAAIEAESLGDTVQRLLGVDEAAGDHVDLGNKRRVVRAIEVWELTGLSPSQRAASKERQMVASHTSFIDHLSFGIDAGEVAHARAQERLNTMVESGLVDEVASLHATLGPVAAQAVGYKELTPVVEGSVPLADGLEAANRATRALIKRQRTFFGRDPRIVWLPWQDDRDTRIASAVDAIERATQWTS